MDLIVDFPQASQALAPRQNDPCMPRVSFAADLEMKFIKNLTYEHGDDLWFSRQEIKSFKYQTACMLKTIFSKNMTMAQYAELNAHETSAFMGLEKFLSRETSREIKYQRDALRMAILYEQQRQIEAGIYDPDTMANISEVASAWCRKRSRIIALLHADIKDEI